MKSHDNSTSNLIRNDARLHTSPAHAGSLPLVLPLDGGRIMIKDIAYEITSMSVDAVSIILFCAAVMFVAVAWVL